MARKKKATATDTPAAVDAIQHQAERSNIPTAEQGPMVAGEPVATVRYPRDPSLDPQLVWKTKDEQDGQSLEVPAVPIYIQEKIQPQALIEDLRRQRDKPGLQQTELFATFDNLDDARRMEFYQHAQQWTNRLILGDSLMVMASLAEKERLKGRVQMIYFDPPYGIKFGSNWQVSTRKREVKDAKADDLTRQPEQIKAFRDTWQLGIHSYLTYLRDRLMAARELLTESGSIFVQIGDENVHLVRCLMDEVFGSENAISQIVFRKTTGAGSPSGYVEALPQTFDYLLWYTKDRPRLKLRRLYIERGVAEDDNLRWVEDERGSRRRMSTREIEDIESGHTTLRPFRPNPLTSQTGGETTRFPVTFLGDKYIPGNGGWKTNKDGMDRLLWANRLIAQGKTLCFVRFLNDFPLRPVIDIWDDTRTSGFGDPKVYVVQTNTKVIERCLLMTTDPGDLVLDPTCGSGTTAYVAEQWGRRWITIDTSRVAVTLARTRLMAAKFPYYLLADSPAGRQREAALSGTAFGIDAPAPGDDIRRGFVYRRVPHVTLKSIANNPDIREGMTREQIDAAILRHAETETLYDQPYEDKSVVRVSGPFTVESLSPHRLLPSEPTATLAAGTPAPDGYVHNLLDYLRKSGVQNTRKNERLRFDTLEAYPGEYLQAQGTYTDEAGQSKRVAVCLGPEFGTVGTALVSKAAQEAHRGMPFDVLLICGFAFDPHVADECSVIEKQIGSIKVLIVRMNPDLTMGEELLKKTGAGNLFMVFGEPDIQLIRVGEQWKVKILGLDVFDPTTSEIRASSTDDLACWFLDTDYDGESFFVRHAYFCGADEPYEKLQRALKADIDESAWATLYATESRPFDRPIHGKIAVKVVNHYGDEVLKVYKLSAR